MKENGKSPDWPKVLSGFRKRTVLVVGDVMLDEYIWGEVERISPEAPVPVVRVSRESWVPGGAANVANNIRSLGGRAIIAGAVGEDHPGRKLKALLRRSRIDLRGLVTDPGRPTVTKSRVLAGHQQVARVDRENTAPLPPRIWKKLLEGVSRLAGEVDGIVVEDYAKGSLNQELIDRLIEIAEKHGCTLVVDPNGSNNFTYRGARLVTPNRKEAFQASGLGPGAGLEATGKALLERWGSAAVLMTLGEDGMCLFEPGRKPFPNPTMAREVFDVSGAGDTVVASVTLALAAGVDLKDAAHLANCAAGVVVGKLGTATVSPEELLEALSRG